MTTSELPTGATHLASSKTCANQAFRIGDNIYGFQFHLEVDQPLIKRWLHVPEHQAELQQLAGQVDTQQILTQTHDYIQRAEMLSNQVFSSFSDLIGHTKK